MLLSCLMADSIIYVLRYFFNFLRNVSLRAGENKMDSSNLAVIFAPNLLQSSDGREKMSANTEKKLRLQAAVVKTLIDHAADIGRVPEFIIEKIPVMLGIDGPCSTPSLDGYEDGECESPLEHKRKRRQSVGDFVSGALNKLKSNRTPSTTPQQEKNVLLSVTPVILTPKTKRKLPMDSSHGFSSKKRKSIKASLNFELLPSNFFSTLSTPASVQFEESPGASSQSSISPIANSGNHLFNTGVQRRSKRIASKKVCRVESGKAGCFSPKISRKEKVRRSLRLKFSLKKSSRDVNRCSGLNRYEHVGRRLASQQDFKNRIESVKTGLLFSPDVDERLTKKGSKHISKSEENLQTPEQTDDVNYRMSWTAPNNNDFQDGTSLPVGTFDKESNPSEPVLTVEIPPELPCELTDINVNDKHENSLTGSSLSGDENNLTTETLVKIQKAFSESGSNLNALISDNPSLESDLRKEKLSEVPNVEFGPEKNLTEAKDYHETTMLSVEKHDENHTNEQDSIVSQQNFLVHQLQNLVKDTTMESHTIQKATKLDENLHLNMPKDYLNKQEFPRNDQTNKQDLPRDKEIITMEETKISIEENEPSCSSSEEVVTKSLGQITCHISKLPRNIRTIQQQLLVQTCDKTLPGGFQMTDHGKVSDHIHWFNKLSLNDSRTESKAKSPLKFQRTPVRQSVRRINSLIEMNRQSGRLASLREVPSPLVKSMSCDSDLSSHIESTSNNSSAAPLYSEHKRGQESMSFAQSSTELTSKSSIELSSKPCSKVKRHPDSWSTSVRPARVCKQKVILGSQIKSVLDDLTNHESLKSVVNTSTAFSVGTQEKTIVRKPSGRERVWYKGSPKNPIAKVQLLPTTKPLEL
ncbi:rho GTPase-activating protein 11A isoform X2 [Trichosurus vulpecula]|nr:rho GTPase-activating protein 11A isoform X2 [Trichosurus vulpecula]